MELAKISHDCPSLDKRAISFLLSRFFLTSSRSSSSVAAPVPSLAIVAPAPSWPQAGRLRELLARPGCERRPCPGREPATAVSSSRALAASAGPALAASRSTPCAPASRRRRRRRPPAGTRRGSEEHMMPANQEALYRGMLRDRSAHRVICSY